MKRLIPDYYAKSIFEVPVSFYQKENIKTILVDLDNTLDGYNVFYPSERVFELIKKLKENNINVIVTSNNHEKRVKEYTKDLNIKYMYHSGKPFGHRIRQYLLDNGYNIKETLLVGDQLMTDIKASKKIGVRGMLTDKIVEQDQWTTKFNRMFDRPIRKKMRKKGILKEREVKNDE